MQVNTPLALTSYYPSSKTPLSLFLPGRKSPHSPVFTERLHYAAIPSISRQSSHLTRRIFHIPQELLKYRLHQATTEVHSICSIPTVTNLHQAKCCLTSRNLTPIRHTRCITLIAVNSYLLDLTECTSLQSTIAYTSKHHVHTRAPGIVSWQQGPFNSAWKNGSWPALSDSVRQDRYERTHRFLEEALELAQANGCTRDDAVALIDYVYSRPRGNPELEVGGVIVTLAGLCSASNIDMQSSGDQELERNWKRIELIRSKHASKPHGSPLPQ